MTTVNSFQHKLGVPARDIVSGFEGKIVSRVQHITGCSTYGFAPKASENGEVKSTEYFNENRVQVIEGEALPFDGSDVFDDIFIIPMGAKVRDKVTGFVGIVTTRVEYLFNANSCGVTPPMDKDGKLPDGYQFDEGRLDIIPDEPQVKPADVASPKRGSMMNRDAPKL